MARVTWSGPAGERWENKTDKVKYQFIASLSNTCGVCLQYHMAIGPWWPIPMHHGCMCRQVLIPPGGTSPEPFVDFREILRGLPPDQQRAAVGRSVYKLLEDGVIPWDEAVTKGRVRTLREIVSRRKLSIDEMTKAGVSPGIAANAHASVNTPAHRILYEQRRKLVSDLKGAGLTDEQLRRGFGSKIAERVGIENPAALAVRKIGPKWTDAASLAKYLGLDLRRVAAATAIAKAIDTLGPEMPDDAMMAAWREWLGTLEAAERAALEAEDMTPDRIRELLRRKGKPKS